MHYQISRNGQMYGPYTLEDLQRYVASGNVLVTDLAKSDEMPEWVPVSALLSGDSSAAAAAPAFTEPLYGGTPMQTPVQAPVSPNIYPDAPNLHWGIYLLLCIITCTLFSKVFIVVQAAWLRRVQPNSKGLLLYGVMYVIFFISFFLGIGSGISMMAHPGTLPVATIGARLFLSLAYLVLLFTTRVIMVQSLQEHFSGPEPMPVQFDTVMAFFFGGVYFQAKLNEVNAIKQAARFGAGFAGRN